MEKIETFSAEETRREAAKIAESLTPGLVLLEGNLGAGKTCFAAGILEALGAEGPYQSPTFTLMKEYELPVPTKTGIKRVLHADAYRVEARDFQELGFSSWLDDPGALILLEWGERVEALLPAQHQSISLTSRGGDMREIFYKTS